MKYKIKVQVPVEKRTLFGKKTVYETRTVEVDKATYLKWKQKQREERDKEADQFFEDMILYDMIFNDDD